MEEGTIGEEGTVPQPSRGAPVGHVPWFYPVDIRAAARAPLSVCNILWRKRLTPFCGGTTDRPDQD